MQRWGLGQKDRLGGVGTDQMRVGPGLLAPRVHGLSCHLGSWLTTREEPHGVLSAEAPCPSLLRYCDHPVFTATG